MKWQVGICCDYGARSMSSPVSRAGPDFAVIGAMRAGTTQLYEMLRGVEGVSVPKMKETDFFCSRKSVSRGYGWYARQFSQGDALWGDISPNYAKTDIHPQAAQLLYEANPEMRIFFIARDPVERAISHYRMVHFIEEDLPAPDDLLATRSGKHILHASSYYTCLLPFWERFGDRVTILDFDMLTEQSMEVVAFICKTLGLPPAEIPVAQGAANSFSEVSRMPGWWSRLRRTELGTVLRGHAPRPLLNFIKAKASLSAPRPPPPPFSENIRRQMTDMLAPDIMEFRKKTGLHFDNWSV